MRMFAVGLAATAAASVSLGRGAPTLYDPRPRVAELKESTPFQPDSGRAATALPPLTLVRVLGKNGTSYSVQVSQGMTGTIPGTAKVTLYDLSPEAVSPPEDRVTSTAPPIRKPSQGQQPPPLYPPYRVVDKEDVLDYLKNNPEVLKSVLEAVPTLKSGGQ
jgi:hypothetical protein